MSLREMWINEVKYLLIRLGKGEVSEEVFWKIVEKKNNLEIVSNEKVTLNLQIFGLNTVFKLDLKRNELTFKLNDFTEEEIESDHLLYIYSRLLNKRMQIGVLNPEDKFINVAMIQGGIACRSYEKRIIDFITSELEGSTAEEIEKTCKIINAKPITHLSADWACDLNVLNGVRIRIAFWSGEENIPSNASILYGAEIVKAGIPVEDINALTETLVNRLVLCYRKVTGRSPRKWKSLYI